MQDAQTTEAKSMLASVGITPVSETLDVDLGGLADCLPATATTTTVSIDVH